MHFAPCKLKSLWQRAQTPLPGETRSDQSGSFRSVSRVRQKPPRAEPVRAQHLLASAHHRRGGGRWRAWHMVLRERQLFLCIQCIHICSDKAARTLRRQLQTLHRLAFIGFANTLCFGTCSTQRSLMLWDQQSVRAKHTLLVTAVCLPCLKTRPSSCACC